MEQDRDWDGISDSELLNIQSEHFFTEEASQPSSSSAKQDDTQNNSSMASVHTTLEKKQSPVSKNAETSMKRKRNAADKRTPILRFGKLHLSVSLLSEQTWCEKKVVYGFLKPHIRKKDRERTEMQTGLSIHLARELEVHDVIQISTYTQEDRFAVNLINMLNMIPSLETGQCVREFPVFGILEGVCLKGVIDELNYNQKGELVLKELKTRMHDSLPVEAQALGHRFQVGLYKLLFDSLVRRELTKEHILGHLKLRAYLPLGAEVITHAANVGIDVITLSELLDAFFITLSCSDLPCVDVLQLEYCHQGSGSIIDTVLVQFDETQLRVELQRYFEYWKGQREPKGVDIEEAWKCTSCPYEEICDWRQSSSQVVESLHTRKRVTTT